MRKHILDSLWYDFADYGVSRCLITNTANEFSIKRIHPRAYITLEIDDEDF